MIILIDTREKENKHITEYFDKQGIEYKRQKLNCGDYTIEGQQDKIFIERKNSITEIAGNFAKGRIRFTKEFERAYATKAKIILMIEDKKTSIDDKNYRSNFSPEDIKNRLKTWCNIFQISLYFVEKKDAGKFIIDTFLKRLGGDELGGNKVDKADHEHV